jgi:hypothetical protein
VGFVRGWGVLVVAGAAIAFSSFVVAASAYMHYTNDVYHGLRDEIWGGNSYPFGRTAPPGSQYSSAEVRHYFSDGSFNVQCSQARYGIATCQGDWGSAPCQKRYVGGTDGLLARHWVRGPDYCGGQMHA